VFHHKLHQYATNSTMGSRTDLTPIEPEKKILPLADATGLRHGKTKAWRNFRLRRCRPGLVWLPSFSSRMP